MLESTTGGSQSNLERWVYALAGPDLRGREAGTEDARRAARLIATHFANLDLDAPNGDDYCAAFSTEKISDQNVIAHLPPRDPCVWVLIGAHYDGLGVDARGRIHPGADDDATGIAVLLELGRLFSEVEQRPKVGLVLAAFGAEEKGLLGSRAYVNTPSIPLERLGLMINVDMAGRKLRGNPGLGYEASGPEPARVARLVRSAALRAKVAVIAMRLGDRGDSAMFSPHVPTVFFSTTVHADYHQPTDTPDRVDYEQVERALGVVRELVAGLDCNGA